MALYRFLFAPVLLAVAVLTTSPRRSSPRPAPARAAVAQPAPASGVAPSHGPARAMRLPSHPTTVP